MKEGALDFLAKPVDPDHLMLLVSRALEQRRIVTENLLMKEELAIRRGAPQLVGEDPSLRKLFAVAAARGGDRHDRAHRRGERHGQGVVRAFAARAEPARGRAVRRDQLRGHPREPARDRAIRLREGRVHGRRRAQARQVRDGAPRHAVPRRDRRDAAGAAGEDPARPRGARFERVGGTASVQIDVRLVAATNRALRAAIAARRFREDLYFRLSVFPITVPPLRERPGDIPLLARYFVERFCRDMKKRALVLSPGAIEQLQAYRWPGNVRELQNCIERAVILAESEAIQPRHLNLSFAAPEPEPPPSPWAQIDLTGSLADATRRVIFEVERIKIETALKEADNNKGRAAELLQISYKMLLAKLREHRLE